jgi:hypothetical protein
LRTNNQRSEDKLKVRGTDFTRSSQKAQLGVIEQFLNNLLRLLCNKAKAISIMKFSSQEWQLVHQLADWRKRYEILRNDSNDTSGY